MPQQNTLPGLIFIILFGLGMAVAYPSWSAGGYVTGAAIAITSLVIASIIANSVKIANQWERLVVVRLGQFRALAGPGLSSSSRSLRPSPIASTSASSPAHSRRKKR